MKQKQKDVGLTKLGERLAKIDRRLVAILAKRARVVVDVACCKMNNGNRPILRKRIEKHRRTQWMKWAREEGFDPEFVRTIFNIVLAESCRIQVRIKEGRNVREKS